MQAYPRPTFVRTQWESLDGLWEFAFDDSDAGLAQEWFTGDRKLGQTIQVPFPYQSPLSGIGTTDIHPVVWYAREFVVPDAWLDEDILLNFGAVDYRCRVWVNGREVGRNQGGHVPFAFNIRPYLHGQVNRIVLRVEDSQDMHQPRGKQSHTGIPHGIDYRCTTGIWQTVWLEPVPRLRIHELQVIPHVESDKVPSLEVKTFLHAPWMDLTVDLEVSYHGSVISTCSDTCPQSVAHQICELPGAPLWTPETPHLLDLKIELRHQGQVVDTVHSYTGLRTVTTDKGQIYLNGEPLYLQMVLDQGYWPDGILAAPNDDALRRDVELTKAMGFNGSRKHQKVEDPRWLYWCDRLGLVVWGEMANARDWSQDAEDAFTAEWERAVVRDRNHPCIIAWVPINESWGVPSLQEQPIQVVFVERTVALTRLLDDTRPVIDNDGWEHTDVGDIAAIHDYTGDGKHLYERWIQGMPERTWGSGSLAHYVHGASYRGQPVVLSEVGGYLFIPDGKEIADMDRLYTEYDTHRSNAELEAKYGQLVDWIAQLPDVSGYCYTQLTDVQPEINGLLTEDRVPKVPVERIRALNEAALARHRSLRA